ncbi:MAG: glycosyltransferase family 2 protein [Burkholderiales bacterium]|nr:glycosyltransferase family 2 protein [Burkholderiales bacterium]
MSAPRETTQAASDPLLSIVVPVYNEASHLGEVIEHMMKSPCPVRREWIFVDDGSTDNSRQILHEMQLRHGFLLIDQPSRRGKGSAIIRGIREAHGDFIMAQDADFEYDSFDVPDLLEPLLQGHADVVYGNRFDKASRHAYRTWHYFWNRLLTGLSNAFSGLHLTDAGTRYKIFRADLLKAMNLKSRRFGIEVELTAYVAKTAAQVYELPVHYHPRARLQEKTANWTDGICALFHLIRFNFLTSPGDAFLDLPEYYRTPHRPRSAQTTTQDASKEKP